MNDHDNTRGRSIVFSKLIERRHIQSTYELARRLEALFAVAPHEAA